ncbi:hypothetical protein F4780DRAFT_767056 [Xylariomycetidae sp. FL0641]|nr:hypothetical protein F4780DRAFT_767056 [Xylariomycetidae sp. FL0641]
MVQLIRHHPTYLGIYLPSGIATVSRRSSHKLRHRPTTSHQQQDDIEMAVSPTPIILPAPTSSAALPAFGACDRWLQARVAETCWTFADRAGIQAEELFRFNPGLGTQGDRCGETLGEGLW